MADEDHEAHPVVVTKEPWHPAAEDEARQTIAERPHYTETEVNAIRAAALREASEKLKSVLHNTPAYSEARDLRDILPDVILAMIDQPALAALEQVKQAERERLIEIANNKKSGFYDGGIDEWEQGFCAAIDAMIAAIRGESK